MNEKNKKINERIKKARTKYLNQNNNQNIKINKNISDKAKKLENFILKNKEIQNENIQNNKNLNEILNEKPFSLIKKKKKNLQKFYN